jgi:hypothetical protein
MKAERQSLATLPARASFRRAAERQEFSTFYIRLMDYVDQERDAIAANLPLVKLASQPGHGLVVLSQTDL